MILSKIYFTFKGIFDKNLVAIRLLEGEKNLSFYYNSEPAHCSQSLLAY